MSDNKVEDNLELEEGEIADDSNDGCSLTNDDDFDQQVKAESSNNNNTDDLIGDSGANLPDDNGATGPQKKRKKVVRKVRRKIKVKKKVVRKKGATNTDSTTTNSTTSIQPTLSPPSNQPSLSQTPLLPPIAQQQQQPQQQPLDSTNLLQNQPQQQQHHQQQQQLQQLINPLQPILPQTQNNQPLDSLWEQQILMLQELQRQQLADQRYAQLLRAAANDEDLRIFHITNTNYGQQQPEIQQTDNKNLSRHQTPSSPDDENGKSSYEAISKMLTLLRNSASLNDPSENSDTDNQTTVDQMRKVLDADHRLATGAAGNNQSVDDKANRNQVEYSLVPILVEGIDYTKYKLLSQYEPKFKNDPRLNSMT